MIDRLGTIFGKLVTAFFLIGVVGVVLTLMLPMFDSVGLSETHVSLLSWGIFAVILTLVFAWKPNVEEDGTIPRCLACGYDLTGNESGTCPECGRSIPLTAQDDRIES